MVSKKYIPIGEKSFRGRERDLNIANDPEMQADFCRVAGKLAGVFSQKIIEKLSGKELFMKYMKTPPEELNDFSDGEWERIEEILRNERQTKTWLEEMEKEE